MLHGETSPHSMNLARCCEKRSTAKGRAPRREVDGAVDARKPECEVLPASPIRLQHRWGDLLLGPSRPLPSARGGLDFLPEAWSQELTGVQSPSPPLALLLNYEVQPDAAIDLGRGICPLLLRVCVQVNRPLWVPNACACGAPGRWLAAAAAVSGGVGSFPFSRIFFPPAFRFLPPPTSGIGCSRSCYFPAPRVLSRHGRLEVSGFAESVV